MLLCPQHSHSPAVTSFVLFLSATSLQPPVILKRAGQSASNLRCSSSPLGPSKYSHSVEHHRGAWAQTRLRMQIRPQSESCHAACSTYFPYFSFFLFFPLLFITHRTKEQIKYTLRGCEVPGRRAPEPLPAGLFAHPERCGSHLTTSEPAASQLPAILIFMLLSSRRFSALRSRCTICRPWQ